MYTVEFYEKNNGECELWNFLDFFYKDNIFVLLHAFRKKTQKTPHREIKKAIAERDDYLARKEFENSENVE